MMRLDRFGLVSAVLLLGGCAATNRPPEAASVVLPESFALLDAETAGAAGPDTLLPTADQGFGALLDRAMAGSPDLEAALARIDAARAGLAGAGAARLPEISASAEMERQRISAAQFGGGGAGSPFQIEPNRTQYSAALNASWDLDIFGGLRASERAARARLDAAGADAAAVRLALIGDIAQAVTQYRTLEARRAIIVQDIGRAEDLAQLTGVRTQAGLAPGIDQVRARALAEQAAARLQPIDAGRAAVLGRVATLAALPTAEVIALLDQGATQVPDTAGALPMIEVPSVMLRRRPDVMAAELRLAAADADLAAAAAARYPRFSITGALGLIALSVGDLFSSDAVIGSLGGGIAGPLLDFGRADARVKQSEAQAREAFANYRRAVFLALGEVETVLGAIAAGEAKVKTLALQVRSDQEALDLAEQRYARGLDSFLAVLDAHRTANASREALALAQGDVQTQRIALYRAMGGGREAGLP